MVYYTLLLFLVCVSVFVLRPLFLPSKETRVQFKSYKIEYKIDQADFTDWMYFLTSNLMNEISHNPKVLSANT